MSDNDQTLPDLVTLPLAQIKAYPGNPRKISAEAVEAVADSIRRFGYVQPIVVDQDHVIIVGHTRRLALEKLGYTEAAVYVSRISTEKAAEYRLVDNRAGELSQWDDKALVLELREWEKDLLDSYFPDIDLEVGLLNDAEVTERDAERGAAEALEISGKKVIPLVEVGCPSCQHTFKVKAESLPGLTDTDLAEMTAAARVS